jgi:WD40 repeat protein
VVTDLRYLHQHTCSKRVKHTNLYRQRFDHLAQEQAYKLQSLDSTSRTILDAVTQHRDFFQVIIDKLPQDQQQQNTNSELDHQLEKLPNVPQAVFNSFQARHEPLCLKDTRVGILNEIRDWVSGNDSRPIFWLNGLAGTGKSTIARTIARENYENGCLAASFFFTRGGGDLAHAGKFFPSIAAQLSKSIPSLKRHICESIRKHDDISGLSLYDQWKDIIYSPLSNLDSRFQQSRFIIVIDALDECEGDNDVTTMLRLFSEVKYISTIQIKLFITSRPETPLRLGFRKMSSIYHHDLILDNVSREIIDQDISTYLKIQFSEIRERLEDIAPDWPGEDRLTVLVKRSEGLFIYAATVCRYIRGNDQWEPEDLITVFLPNDPDSDDKAESGSLRIPQKSPFSHLDTMYTQILERSLKDIEDPQDQVNIAAEMRNIIGAIAALFQPLPTAVLAKLLDTKPTIINRRLRHLRSIVNLPDDETFTIRLLHPSFRDFLFDNGRCTSSVFHISKEQIHTRIAEHCINVLSDTLKYDICGVERYGTLVSDVDTTAIEQFIPPEVRYACLYWTQHVIKSRIKLFDNDKVHEFLDKKLLFWLEAASWIGKLTDAIHAILLLETNLSVSACSSCSVNANYTSKAGEAPYLLKLVHDAKRFTLYSRAAIELAPLQLYVSGLIFAPHESKIRQKFKDLIPGSISQYSKTEQSWSPILQTLEGHYGRVDAVTFSPDGTIIATKSDGMIEIWDTHSGQVQQVLEGYPQYPKVLVFSPDGMKLASASVQGTVELWDIRLGHKIKQLTLPRFDPFKDAVTFSLDISMIGTVSSGRVVEIIDLHSGREQCIFREYTISVDCMTFSPDGTTIALSEKNGVIRLWNIVSGKEYQKFRLSREKFPVSTLTFSPDGKTLAVTDRRRLEVWDVSSGEKLYQTVLYLAQMEALAFSADRAALAFSADGATLAAASCFGRIKTWDANSGAELREFSGQAKNISAATFSPDGKYAAMVSNDTTVTICGMDINPLPPPLKDHFVYVTDILLSPDGTVVASVSSSGEVKLWDICSGRIMKPILKFGSIKSLSFSTDSSILAVASLGNVYLWYFLREGQCVAKLKAVGSIVAMAFSKNGIMVATFKHIKIWNTHDQQLRLTIDAHKLAIINAAFSPDGSIVASTTFGNTIKLWDAYSGQELKTIAGFRRPASKLSFSPDGTIIVAALKDLTIRLWDAHSGVQLQVLRIGFIAKSISFSSDGPWLNNDRQILDFSSNLAGNIHFGRPALFVDTRWITRGSERLLRLPSGYRVMSYDTRGDLIALGYESGLVSIFEFTA